MIRSQAIVSNPRDPFKVLPPSSFLVFGQRFTVDSFILSHMVFDSIVFKGRKQERMMPSGLDLMAALGNDEASTLVSDVQRLTWGLCHVLFVDFPFIAFHRSPACSPSSFPSAAMRIQNHGHHPLLLPTLEDDRIEDHEGEDEGGKK